MRRFIPIFLFFFCIAPGLMAQDQLVSFGVKGGVPVTPARPGYGYDNPYLDTGRWTVGPSIEFHLIAGLSLEFDALFRGYKIIGSNEFIIANGETATSPTFAPYKQDVKAWDFPLLAKYRLPGARVRPFFDLGFQATHESSDFTESYFCLPGTLPCPPYFGGEFKSSTVRRGPVSGVGVEFRYRRFRFDPEVRYTHLTPNINQVTLLAGVTF